ncbi:hypothetical protein GCM10023264_08400 [Sphingomonas daechungensis]|uniref:TonB-dependent receptor domain-containing protein n=1 Tax=Sphingomonas daechungensis TaxID=1176646 RepID=UPI0031EB02C7
MFAADPPAIVAPAEQEEDVIEVVATRSDQAQRIDRRTYRVNETPHSAQADSLQLLRGLPAVTITPDDQIMLLGASGVTIVVDERPVQGDPIAYLRTLHGSDIERIEVITNPSAQYSAQGTGGIINFVLRQKKKEGMTGSGSIQASSLGYFNGTGSIRNKKGKLTYEIQLQGRAGRYNKSTYRKLRTVELVPGVPTINTEDGGGDNHSAAAWGSGKLTYELSARTNISGSMFGGGWVNDNRNDVEFVGLTPDFISYSERYRGGEGGSFGGMEFTYDHKGKVDGETLKASAVLFGNPNHRQHLFTEYANSTFRSERESSRLYTTSKVDWVHPMGKDKILSTGAEWAHESHDNDYRFEFTGPSQPPNQSESFSVHQNKLSGFVTFQKTFGTWTLMPGARVESLWRTVKSPGFPTADVSRTNLFPTFHLEHPLGKSLNLTLSYSKRIDRPWVDQLRPFPIQTGSRTIDLGNPDLQDQTTDSFEVNLHYSRKKLEVGLILYDRETDRLWSSSYFVDANGRTVATIVNAGERSDRGAQFDVSSPLFKRVKGMASVNLFDSRVPIDPVFSSDSERLFRYTANGTLEWRGKDKGQRPGDVAQIQFNYESRSRDFQIRRESYVSVDLSWTHSFSRTFSMTANLDGLGTKHYRHRLIAPTIQEIYERRVTSPVFKLKLTKTIGSGPPPPSTGPAMQP